MIAVVDYGAGNLYSVCNSLRYLSVEHLATGSRADIERADGVILPGVGAFADAMGRLQESGLAEALCGAAREKPLLGVCLGMQALFERGYEFGATPGLGLIPGEVRPIEAPGLKIPHMGWNSVRAHRPCALTEGMRDGEYVYFVHSFAARVPAEYIVLSAEYGQTIPALVRRGHVYGAQFHPEKSAAAGLRILQNFDRLVRRRAEEKKI